MQVETQTRGMDSSPGREYSCPALKSSTEFVRNPRVRGGNDHAVIEVESISRARFDGASTSSPSAVTSLTGERSSKIAITASGVANGEAL